MGLWRTAKYRIRALFGAERLDSEMDGEMRFHIEMLAREYEADGLDPKAAKKKAHVDFGGLEKMKEETRDSWGTRVVVDLIRGFQFGLRLCLRYKSSSVLSVIVLSIGIGISVVIYIATAPFLEFSSGAEFDERHLFLEWETGSSNRKLLNSHDFKVFREEVESLGDLIGFQTSSGWIHLPGERDEVEQFNGAFVTSNFFSLTNITPLLGRVFLSRQADFEKTTEIVISDALWNELYSRDEAAVGSVVIVNDQECVVVGVMPKEFGFPYSQKFWIASEWKQFDGARRDKIPNLSVIGKLTHGVSIDKARLELNTLAANLAVSYPETNEQLIRVRLSLCKVIYGNEGAGSILVLRYAASILVLLVACVNVFQVLVSRTAGRSHELAVRCSLGAKRNHIMWQVVVDGLVLAGLGALLGIGLAAVGLKVISAYLSRFTTLSGMFDLSLEPRVILFAGGAAVFSGLVASLLPAWRASKANTFDVLKDDSKSSSSVYIGRLSKAIVISQVAFSSLVIFFCLSFLFFIRAQGADQLELPYSEKTVLTALLWLGADDQLRKGDPQDLRQFYRELDQRLTGNLGVYAVALTTSDYGLGANGGQFRFDDIDQDEWRDAGLEVVTPNLLKVYGLDMISGEMIDDFDTSDSVPVCVVDEEFVAVHCKGVDPIGLRVKVKRWQKPESADWITIVGVIPNLKPKTPFPSSGNILVPYTQMRSWQPSLLVGAIDAGNSELRRAVRESLRNTAPSVQIFGGVQTVEERLGVFFGIMESSFKAGGVFGVSALAVSLIGLYSIVAFTTAQRRKEFGIRMAVGADKWGIAQTILKPWVITTALGLALGALLIAFLPHLLLDSGAGGPMASLFDESFDLMGLVMKSFLLTVLIVCFANLMSMIAPTWQAARVNPMDVIRDE